MQNSNARERTGTITRWVKNRGFGYITCGSGSEREEFFLHFSELTGEPQYQATVQFDVDPVKQGRFRTAINAVIVEGGAL